jgi:hypothetical protein
MARGAPGVLLPVRKVHVLYALGAGLVLGLVLASSGVLRGQPRPFVPPLGLLALMGVGHLVGGARGREVDGGGVAAIIAIAVVGALAGGFATAHWLLVPA